MKAVWYERNGPAREVLQCGEIPDLVPGAGEVLIRVHASGVNPSDWKTRSGSRPMVAARIIPHSDGAGVVERVGTGVDPSRVGERVWIWNGQWKRPFGTAATYIALPSEQAVRLPDGTTFEAGACLGIPALTAHRAVTIDVSPQDQSILVSGGAGAVGHYAMPEGPSSETQHDSKSGKRRPAPARWPCPQMARRPNDSARSGDEPSDCPSLWPRRASPAPLPPILVPVVRSRHGDGLALLRYHHQRHWGAETRPDAARRRTSRPRLRWTRQAFPADTG